MTLTNFFRKNTLPSIFDDEFFKTAGEDRGFYPKANIIDEDKNYRVEIEVPGIKKDQIEITFKNNVLKVKGEKNNQLKTEKTNYYSFESSYGNFERSWMIRDVEKERIDASFNDGVLEIILPKKEELINNQQTQKIAIS